MRSCRSFLRAGSVLVLLVGASWAGEPKWKQHTVSGQSEFEAASAFDVDNDGKIDIVCGSTWYKAPTWSPRPIRDVQRVGTYYNDFATLPLDVNGDGNTDFVTVSYFGKNVGWVENTGKTGAKWTFHELDVPGSSEAAWAVDLTGDGIPDILPNVVNTVVWYEVVKQAAGKGFDIKKRDFGPAAAAHGVGSGDVNGDGRVDLLTPKGWFEAPANPSRETWT
ncbi:MAG: FG-GAP repeat domain-containing protein, partial [Isosphaeraceae bacterium]